MPFGPFADFDDCVQTMTGKVDDPHAYCGRLQAELKNAGPVLIDVAKMEAAATLPPGPERAYKEYKADILKAEGEKQLIYGIVLEPEVIDAQGDMILAADIEQAAHGFLARSRTVGDMHRKKAMADVVESYIAPVEFQLGGQTVKKGSWVIAVRVHDEELWNAVKAGEYTGFSVGGFGRRIPAQDGASWGVA